MTGHSQSDIESSHRMANILQFIVSDLKAERDRTSDLAARNALNNASARVLAMSKFNRYIAAHSTDNEIELTQVFGEVLAYLGTIMDVDCIIEGDPVAVGADLALKLVRAVTELVINANKHAYAGKAGLVTVSIRRPQESHICVTVSDRGKGIGDGLKRSGMGMLIVSSIMEQLKGELKIDNRNGAHISLLAPLPHANAELLESLDRALPFRVTQAHALTELDGSLEGNSPEVSLEERRVRDSLKKLRKLRWIGEHSELAAPGDRNSAEVLIEGPPETD